MQRPPDVARLPGHFQRPAFMDQDRVCEAFRPKSEFESLDAFMAAASAEVEDSSS